MSAQSILSQLRDLQIAIEQAREYGHARQGHFRHRIQFRYPASSRRRRVRLRRRDRTSYIHRRSPRRAASASSVPGSQGSVRSSLLLINNVETYANIAQIILQRRRLVHSPSVPKSPRAPRFSLSAVRSLNTGLVEIPMGTTLREIVEEIGGGIPERQKVQGCSDRRSFRRMYSRFAHRHPDRL